MALFKNKNQSNNRSRERRRPDQRMPGRQPLGRIPEVGQNRTFSYHAARSQNEYNVGREAIQNKSPARRLPTKLQRLRQHSGIFFLVVVSLILVVFEMQLSAVPKVVALTNTSDAPFLQSTDIYQREAAKLFQGSLSNRNKFTVNAPAIEASLQAKFPELKDVSVALPVFGHQPTVYVQPASPALILVADNGTFVVDENGRALIKADASTQLDNFKVPTITDQSGLQIRLGKQALAHQTTTFIQTITGQLQARHVSVKAMTLPAASSELDVYISGKSYFVKFNLQATESDAANAQAGTFLALKQYLDRNQKTPNQYIDVRLSGRAYYK